MHDKSKPSPLAGAACVGEVRQDLASGSPENLRTNFARSSEERHALVSDLQSVLLNIARFATELQKSAALQKRLAYARCWYACQDNEGQWQFGPSKFVGYDGMTADGYINTTEDRDGRRTEVQLQRWFAAIDPGSKLGNELGSALYRFLAMYGKAPSTKMRISVPNKVHEVNFEAVASEAHDALVETIVAAAKALPPSHFEKLRAQLLARGRAGR
jgi:hypothetical protein